MGNLIMCSRKFEITSKENGSFVFYISDGSLE